MIAGVYAIYLTGTPYVYIGETQNIERRWAMHRDAWVYPHKAEYVLLYAASARSVRLCLEEVEHDAALKDGLIPLSFPGCRRHALHRARISRNVSEGWSKRYTAVERSDIASRRAAAMTVEERREKFGRRSQAAKTAAQRSEAVRKTNAAQTPEQHRARLSKAWNTRRRNKLRG